MDSIMKKHYIIWMRTAVDKQQPTMLYGLCMTSLCYILHTSEAAENKGKQIELCMYECH